LRPERERGCRAPRSRAPPGTVCARLRGTRARACQQRGTARNDDGEAFAFWPSALFGRVEGAFAS
jgi:hypothetical protein